MRRRFNAMSPPLRKKEKVHSSVKIFNEFSFVIPDTWTGLRNEQNLDWTPRKKKRIFGAKIEKSKGKKV